MTRLIFNFKSDIILPIPEDLHRKIKRIQLDLENQSINKTVEEIYIDFIERGLNQYKLEQAVIYQNKSHNAPLQESDL